MFATAGAVVVTVAGQVTVFSQNYSFVDLILPPVVTAVSPLSGPLSGGTAVTVIGVGFNSVAVVTFEELLTNGTATGVRYVCTWSPNDLPGTLCNATAVVYVTKLA